MALQPGTVLEQRYRVDSLLGQGGMGAVYRAWDERLGIWVALKENALSSPEACLQFEREARVLARLHHSNLPKVMDHFITSDVQYLVMTFVEGRNLSEVLAIHGRQSPAEVANWLGQVSDALTYLHSQSPPIIHRDIKPQNIKITSDGRVFLVDFGLSKIGSSLQSTASGAQGVTPGFSPWEQYGQGHTDKRSDVYALTATLYTMLTGEIPPDSVRRGMAGVPLRPPRELNPHLSVALEQALLHGLETQPNHRPDDVLALRQEVEAGLVQSMANQTSISGRPSWQPPSTSTSAVPASRRRPSWERWAFLAAGILVVLILLLSIVIMTNRSNPTMSMAVKTVTPNTVLPLEPPSHTRPPAVNQPTEGSTALLSPTLSALPVATATSPAPTATLLPTRTPRNLQVEASINFVPVSLEGAANSSTSEGYVGPPTGSVVLSGVRFDLGKGRTITTQAAPLPDNPKSIVLPVDAAAPQAVYLLITGGDLYNRFAGQIIGRVRLVFGDGKVHAVNLVAGHNVREWKLSADVVGSTTSSELTEVWRGTNRDDTSAAVIDMLRIPIPAGLQAGRLVSIEVDDLSAETVGDLDPALNLLGVSVALKPAPTATPTPIVGKVIFGSDRSGYAHIFTVRGNGQSLRAITGGNEYFWNPVLSNDGALVAYVSKVNGNTEIFVARNDGSSAQPISNHPAEDDHPAWFPDNRELAFASNRDGGWDIYRMNADGSNVRRLTADGGDNRFVAVSPDGSQIAYVSQNADYPSVELMVMNADGSNRRVLYSYASRKQRDDPGRFLYRPDWSPDGARIAFGADDDDDGLISVILIDAASGQAQRVIRDGNSPAWSPDGLRLVYKPAGEQQILFVADAAGNRLYQLTAGTYNAWSPDWAR